MSGRAGAAAGPAQWARPNPATARRLVLLMLAWLGACAATPPPEGPPRRLVGRLAVQVDAYDAQPAQGAAAGFEFDGDDAIGELRLMTPLGTLFARARWQPGRVDLSTPLGERVYPNLDTLSEATFGQPLPLRALPDWAEGRPWAQAPSRPLVPGPGFEQLGWSVDTSRAAEGRIDARRTGPPAVRLRVLLDAPA
jgi:outer membrane lipoprotein LolB